MLKNFLLVQFGCRVVCRIVLIWCTSSDVFSNHNVSHISNSTPPTCYQSHIPIQFFLFLFCLNDVLLVLQFEREYVFDNDPIHPNKKTLSKKLPHTQASTFRISLTTTTPFAAVVLLTKLLSSLCF